MKNHSPEKIDIFLIVSPEAVEEHFNKNDPAPFYKRQLSHEFEEYINKAKAAAREHSFFEYKITCKKEEDRQYTEPLMYAVKRHFSNIMLVKQEDFEKFKRRNYMVLFVGLLIILLSHILIPTFISESSGVEAAILTGIDIFSWVMMWQPIDNLLFHLKAHLEEINTIKKLTEAGVVYTENDEV
jgi:hypothetical protein